MVICWWWWGRKRTQQEGEEKDGLMPQWEKNCTSYYNKINYQFKINYNYVPSMTNEWNDRDVWDEEVVIDS
jgi:hypothetical protein